MFNKCKIIVMLMCLGTLLFAQTLQVAKRPAKVGNAKDISPANLEKIFRYYDSQLQGIVRGVPVSAQSAVQSNNVSYIMPNIEGKQNLNDTLLYDATIYWTDSLFTKKTGYRYARHYDDDFIAAIKDGESVPQPGVIYGVPARLDTIFGVTLADMISLESNTNIVLPVDHTIQMNKVGGLGAGVSIFSAIGKKNISISGGILEGGVNTTYYRENDMGFYLKADTNITIRDMNINNMGGDGIYISGGCNITIDNVMIYSPNVSLSPLVGRQAISIVNASSPADAVDVRRLKITNCVFTGGAPATIDFEQNVGGVVEDVIIDNCTFTGTGAFSGLHFIAGAGMTIRNVFITNCLFENFAAGFYMHASSGCVIENIVVDNCIAINCDVGFYLRAGTADLRISNCTSSYNNYGALVYSVHKNIEFANCDFRYNKYHGIFFDDGTPTSRLERGSVNGCRFYNNGTGGTGHGIYAERVLELKVVNCRFEYNNGYPVYVDGAQGIIFENNLSALNTSNVPYFVNTCNDIIQKGNIWGDSPFGQQEIVFSQKNTTPGWHRSVTLLDTTSADSFDTVIRVGGQNAGNTSALRYHTTSKNQLVFSSWRDVRPDVIGAKIVAQNYASYSLSGYHYYTQESNLLFYLLHSKIANKKDDTDLVMVLNGNGIGLQAGKYLTFKSDLTDTSYRHIGASGYGFRDNAGTMQFKNSGGAWVDVVGTAKYGEMPVTIFPGANAPTLRTWAGNIKQYAYNHETQDDISYGSALVPRDYAEDTDVSISLHTAIETSPSAGDTVVWLFECTWTNVDDTVSTSFVDTVKVPVSSWTAKKHKVSSVRTISGTGKKIGSQIDFAVSRFQSNASDTYDGWVFLKSVDIHYVKDGIGSEEKFVK